MPAKNKSCFPYASGLSLKLMSFEVSRPFFLSLANNTCKMCPGLHLDNEHTLFSTSAECLLTTSPCYSGLAVSSLPCPELLPRMSSQTFSSDKVRVRASLVCAYQSTRPFSDDDCSKSSNSYDFLRHGGGRRSREETDAVNQHLQPNYS